MNKTHKNAVIWTIFKGKKEAIFFADFNSNIEHWDYIYLKWIKNKMLILLKMGKPAWIQYDHPDIKYLWLNNHMDRRPDIQQLRDEVKACADIINI